MQVGAFMLLVLQCLSMRVREANGNSNLSTYSSTSSLTISVLRKVRNDPTRSDRGRDDT